MQIKTLMMVCLLTIPICNQAQNAETKRNAAGGGGGGFTIGYGNMDIGELQNFLPAGLKSLSSAQTLIGGSGHGLFGKFLIGGTGYAVSSSAVKTDTMTYSPGGGIGTFDIGYLLLNRRNLKMYPMLGLGGGGYGIQITRTGTFNAGKIAGSPARELNISHGGFVADLSFNINLIPNVEFDEKEKSYGGFMCGLRLGFLFSMPHSDWTYAGGDISDGPEFCLNMLYLKLIIGGAGYQEKQQN